MCGWWQCYHTQWWNPQKKYMFVCLYQFQDLFEFMRIYDGGINILGWSSRGSHNSITADNAVSLQKQHTRDNHIVANDRSRVHIFIIIVVINLHISSARSSCSHPDHWPPTIGLTQCVKVISGPWNIPWGQGWVIRGEFTDLVWSPTHPTKKYP